MAINKIILNTDKGEEVLINLSSDTVNEETLFEGVTSHNAQGESITGTFPNGEIGTQADLIEQIKTALVGKGSGTGSAKPEQEKSVEITKNGTTEVTPDSGKTLSKVTITTDVPGYEDGYNAGVGDGHADGYSLGYKEGSERANSFIGLVEDSIESFEDFGISKIAQYGMAYRENLKTLSLPNLKSSNTRAFSNCDSLTSLSIPNMSGYTYQYMCAYCGALKTADVRQASYISSYSFYNCYNLTKLEFNRVGTIATNSFNGCTKLATLILRSTSVVTLSGTSAFTGTKIAGTGGYIYVPSSLVEDYKSASNWSTYASKFRAIEDYPDITGGA